MYDKKIASAGAEAYRQGVLKIDNPYFKNTEDYDSWNVGYEEEYKYWENEMRINEYEY